MEPMGDLFPHQISAETPEAERLAPEGAMRFFAGTERPVSVVRRPAFLYVPAGRKFASAASGKEKL